MELKLKLIKYLKVQFKFWCCNVLFTHEHLLRIRGLSIPNAPVSLYHSTFDGLINGSMINAVIRTAVIKIIWNKPNLYIGRIFW